MRDHVEDEDDSQESRSAVEDDVSDTSDTDKPKATSTAADPDYVPEPNDDYDSDASYRVRRGGKVVKVTKKKGNEDTINSKAGESDDEAEESEDMDDISSIDSGEIEEVDENGEICIVIDKSASRKAQEERARNDFASFSALQMSQEIRSEAMLDMWYADSMHMEDVSEDELPRNRHDLDMKVEDLGASYAMVPLKKDEKSKSSKTYEPVLFQNKKTGETLAPSPDHELPGAIEDWVPIRFESRRGKRVVRIKREEKDGKKTAPGYFEGTLTVQTKKGKDKV